MLQRSLVLVASALVIASATPRISQAQICFRGHPTPRCGGFAILEFTAGTRLGTEIDRYRGDNTAYLSWSGGYLHNLGERSSLGVVLKLAADDDGHRYGPMLRYRQWLGPTWSIDLGPGLLVGGTDNLAARQFPSAMLDVAVNWGDRVGLDLGLEGVRRVRALGNGWDGHVGLRFGSWYAPLAMLGLTLLAAASYH